ncbi:hypothetical protein PF005_g12273 [Phytophthora fragariae]|uniref:Uncharacterized protein n=1 Tax=Phytophthora fragariae TaxID=53985 RepID=A0A6A3S9B3_9STRA|nr:hypothetical protein PF003_g30552 [Phytophthora fragariae]KAE8926704.1 hypothetical protein PF009_g23112 [Phytophthora fragariae]KAE8984024.1 hypothetical protein PF011_g20937 [Phytophthora fragariae]KAE9080742.1 hypothetical protein PF007_g22923 [Phytophthora fragariae]KAE9111240.1 hypothetical protein PF006_g20257 [Phytophthora fragariae]
MKKKMHMRKKMDKKMKLKLAVVKENESEEKGF